MADKTSDGGFAFPAPYDGHGSGPGGMSMREWFAGQAVIGIISTSAAPCLTGFSGAEKEIAETAFKIADAMLESRGQQ